MKGCYSYFCLLLALGLSSISHAQSSPPPPKPAPPRPVSVDIVELFGELKDRTYLNRFFGFKLEIPEELTILDRTEIKLYNDAGAEMIKSQAESGTAKLDDAVRRSINILVVTKLPLGAVGNSAIEFVTAKQMEGATSKMVLAETVSVMTGTGTFRKTGVLPTTKFSGIPFEGVDMESTAFGVPLHHRTYVTVIKNYALVVTLTLQKNTPPDEFEKLLQSIEPIRKSN